MLTSNQLDCLFVIIINHVIIKIDNRQPQLLGSFALNFEGNPNPNKHVLYVCQ